MPFKPLTDVERAEVEALDFEVFDIRQVAAILKVTERSVMNYLKSGKLKGRKISGRWRFTRADIQAYIDGDN